LTVHAVLKIGVFLRSTPLVGLSPPKDETDRLKKNKALACVDKDRAVVNYNTEVQPLRLYITVDRRIIIVVVSVGNRSAMR
jgi:hypothetical protein